jgi:hypothetical protein
MIAENPMFEKPVDLEKAIGQRVSIKGVAHNAKVGAVILTEWDEVVYLRGIREWPERVIGKRIVKEGILRRQKIYPDVKVEGEARSQGLQGDQFLLEVEARKASG